MPARAEVALRLRVRNHPGVMSHVCGLFARRAFNVEGIVCLPIGDGAESAVLLLVHDDDRLEQLIRQLAKLEDVRAIVRTDEAAAAFAAAAALLSTERPGPVWTTERPRPLSDASDQSSQPRNGPT